MREIDQDIRTNGIKRLCDPGVARRIRARDARHELQVARRLYRSGDGTTRPAGNAGHADADHKISACRRDTPELLADGQSRVDLAINAETKGAGASDTGRG